MAAWETAHVLFARADRTTGAVTCQLGDIKSGEVYEPNAPVFQAWGMLTLPAPPVAGVSAPEAVSLKGTSSDVVVGGRSVRSAKIAGIIKQGESAFFADGSQAVIIEKLDGSINLLTTHDNTDTGRNVNFRVAPDGMKFEWPWSRFKVEKDGLHYDHSEGFVFDHSVVELSGPFSVLSQFKNMLHLRFDIGKIEASAVSIGPQGSVKSPVARADATVAALELVSTALSATSTAMGAVQTALVALQGTGTGPGAPAAITAAATAVTAAATALSAATAGVAAAAVGTVPVPGPIGASALATS